MGGDSQRVVRNLVHFEQWMDPIGPEIIGADGNIKLQTLTQNAPSDAIWTKLETAHGYQLLPSTETLRAFHPDRPFLERCPNLLCISSSGAGYDMVDIAACTEAGILVVNQGGANAQSVVQHTIGMMLVLCKKIVQSDNAIRRPVRDWDRFDYTGHELTGRTLGIVGLGNIGRRLAALASSAFDMRVIASDPYITPRDFEERHAEAADLERVLREADFDMRVIASDPYITPRDFEERHAEAADLERVLREADFVSLHCPLTDETRRMIGAEEFAMMKPGAFFLNTARGGIHDEAALEKALDGGALAGAGLDVFETEPPPSTHPLLDFDNVIVSPHNAGVTSDCLRNMAEWAARQWVGVFRGRRPPRLINPEAWGFYTERYARILGERVSG